MREKFYITNYNATKNPKKCVEFRNGHKAVLGELGLTTLESYEEDWWNIENEHILVVMDCRDGQQIAGCRLQPLSVNRKLPAQRAIEYFDNSLDSIVGNYKPNEFAEVCGLWINSKGRGHGFAHILARSAIILSQKLGYKGLMIFCSQYTHDSSIRLGFKQINSIGNAGFFDYPTPMFQSSILMIEDLSKEVEAMEADKQKIEQFQLHNSAVQIEFNKDGEFEIEYNFLV